MSPVEKDKQNLEAQCLFLDHAKNKIEIISVRLTVKLLAGCKKSYVRSLPKQILSAAQFRATKWRLAIVRLSIQCPHGLCFVLFVRVTFQQVFLLGCSLQ